jgi:superfamily II DNA or RNA helicase
MARNGTSASALPLIAAGAQVVVRDEEWLVRSTQHTPADGLLVRCLGTTPLVRDTEAMFLTNLDRIEPMRPEDTVLVVDDSPQFRRSRLYLEAMLRKTPIPATDTGLAVADRMLLNPLEYQRRAARKALTGLRPRLLIADAVGLGKTLEVGLILSELIRRGRGDKILVVTPRHILEQFQHELWTRFAIPLVRLDSEGIQRVRRKIPGNRNPFTYYKRAIISIDTLKNAGRYRHHLEGIRWDAVVIDECHNLVNRGTLNNQLARVLAPRTEALLLTSATPHNGDRDSFYELARMLDPTAVPDPDAITAEAIEHLYVRRHKRHDEVRTELGTSWADRLAPRALPVVPSAPEAELYSELADTWIYPVAGKAPTSGQGRSLFPWTLLKAALSSHRALAQTVTNRRRTLARKGPGGAEPSPEQAAEDAALASLARLCDRIDDTSATKLDTLLAQLTDIGIGSRSPARAVVFSERIATLDWLAKVVPPRLGLKPDQVLVLHGGLADVKQMDVIEKFGLADAPVRLLLTGDMASEGVNLHRQCHNLIHYDLPWSLITIEQRNGRIDRYGQADPPDIRALLVTPDHPRLTGDVRVLTRLLEREHEQHRALGDAGSLFGLHDAALEEEAVMKALQAGIDADRIVPEEPAHAFDLLTLVAGGTGHDPVPVARRPSLFADDHAFVTEALRAVFDDPVRDLDLRDDPQDPALVSLVPPRDLSRRFGALPQSYLAEQRVTERLRVTSDPHVADTELARARNATDSQWPEVGHLSPLHPLTEWLVDKVLTGIGRNQAPIVIGPGLAAGHRPVFCVVGQYANGRGQPQLVEWLAITPGDVPSVDDLFDALATAGVSPQMPNPGVDVDTGPLAKHLPAVVAAARTALAERRNRHDATLDQTLAAPQARLDDWVERRMRMAADPDRASRRGEIEREAVAVGDDTRALIESLRTTGDPLVRVLAVLVPRERR